jgi:hypothetical protein
MDGADWLHAAYVVLEGVQVLMVVTAVANPGHHVPGHHIPGHRFPGHLHTA